MAAEQLPENLSELREPLTMPRNETELKEMLGKAEKRGAIAALVSAIEESGDPFARVLGNIGVMNLFPPKPDDLIKHEALTKSSLLSWAAKMQNMINEIHAGLMEMATNPQTRLEKWTRVISENRMP